MSFFWFEMTTDKDSRAFDDYINPVVILIFCELRRNIAFNIVMFGVVIYGVISMLLQEEYIYAMAWILVGLACLQKIFYFFLDQFVWIIFFYGFCTYLRDGYYYSALGWLLLLWYWSGWLIGRSYPAFKSRMNRVVEDPYEWTEM